MNENKLHEIISKNCIIIDKIYDEIGINDTAYFHQLSLNINEIFEQCIQNAQRKRIEIRSLITDNMSYLKRIGMLLYKEDEILSMLNELESNMINNQANLSQRIHIVSIELKKYINQYKEKFYQYYNDLDMIRTICKELDNSYEKYQVQYDNCIKFITIDQKYQQSTDYNQYIKELFLIPIHIIQF